MAVIVLLLIVAGICGCSRKVYVPVERTRIEKDSTALYRADSLSRLLASRDTIIRRDSIVTLIKGDTLIKEVWRWRERTSVVRDTIREAARSEQAQLIVRRDSVPYAVEVEKIVEVAKPQKWWQKGLQWTGGLCWVSFLLIAGYAWLRWRASRK